MFVCAKCIFERAFRIERIELFTFAQQNRLEVQYVLVRIVAVSSISIHLYLRMCNLRKWTSSATCIKVKVWIFRFVTQCKRQSWFVLVENKTWDLPCHWASCWFTFTPAIKIWKEQAPFQFLRTRNQCFFWGQTNAFVSCCILQNGLASFSFFLVHQKLTNPISMLSFLFFSPFSIHFRSFLFTFR